MGKDWGKTGGGGQQIIGSVGNGFANLGSLLGVDGDVGVDRFGLAVVERERRIVGGLQHTQKHTRTHPCVSVVSTPSSPGSD